MNIDDLCLHINEYQKKYRHPDLAPFKCVGEYSLNGEVRPAQHTWPDSYPSGDASGIYAVFHFAELLYVGKASHQPLSWRMGSHWKYSEDKSHAAPKSPNWSKPPTHLCFWAVPDDSRFEAAALEEYLISKLDLPDNKTGNKQRE